MFSEEFTSLSYTTAEDTHSGQEKIMKKRNIHDKVPYGRRRSCWKKNYSSGIVKEFHTDMENEVY